MPPHALLTRARLAGAAALAAVAICVSSTIGVSAAESKGAGLGARERQALLALYADDTAIARAQGAVDRATAEANAIDRHLAQARRDARFAKTALRTARIRLAARLRAWYERGGSPDAVEIFLGASSLSDAVSELELWHRATGGDRSTIQQTRAAARRFSRAGATLKRAHDEALARHAALVQHVASLKAARSAQAALLDSLRRQARAAARVRRVAVIAKRAEHAARRSAEISPPDVGDQQDPTPLVQVDPPPTVANPVHPGGTLSVSSTAYSLPGNTASGLPTGQGVCATDPSVIPLGTRFDVPGYGSCIAADTGSAIIGARIDVWVPTLALAEGWGRRQITITFE